MADAMPAPLKGLQLAPFAKRAAQLERFRPIITYWLRFYMVQRIIAAGLHAADAACTAYTTQLMERLEQAKADHPAEDALADDTAARAYCEQFALQTFAKGDRDMAEKRANSNTADTLQAASTFLEMLAIWAKEPQPDVASKTKFAKFHALRILKAIKAGEDPNLTNPAPQTQDTQLTPQPPVTSPPAAYLQPYVESAPDTSAQPSPPTTFSPPSHNHNDVSPISPPVSSRRASATSIGGGYFPRTEQPPPTFTAETTAPGLPTAPSMEPDPLTSSLPSSPQVPSATTAPDPASFYQNPMSPPPINQPPPQPLAPHTSYQSPPANPFSPQPQSPPALQQHQQPPPPSIFQSNPAPLQQPQFQYAATSPQPPQQYQEPPRGSIGGFPPPAQGQFSAPVYQNPYAQPSAPPPQPLLQGPFRNDEDSIMEAQKHAKWAISALNFEDADTAVKELRIALRALGAN